MTDARIMAEISQMPDVRRKWKALSRERKEKVLVIVDGCADKACLLAAIRKVAGRDLNGQVR